MPIGVFDSGMGGLTVLAALREALPGENYLYLGDTARLPYGTKSPETVRRYAAQAAQHLRRRGVKALVVACNTASAFGLSHLTELFAPLPVFGVVEPGAQAAVAQASDDGVLVLATESTIAGGAYQRALLARVPHLPIYGRACPLWVTLAEQGLQDASFIRQVLHFALRGFITKAGSDMNRRIPKTLLLGCTHFPVFKDALRELLPSDRQIVDSAATTAADVARQLADLDLLNPQALGDCHYFATDGKARFKQVGSYFLGDLIEEVELIDL